MRLTSIESSFHPCNIYRDCHRGVPREAKMCQTGESSWHIAANISLFIYYSCSYLQSWRIKYVNRISSSLYVWLSHLLMSFLYSLHRPTSIHCNVKYVNCIYCDSATNGQEKSINIDNQEIGTPVINAKCALKG